MSQVVIFSKVAACKSQPVTFNPSCKKYASLTSIFLGRLAKSCIKSCKYLASLALKMKVFLQDIKNLAKFLQKIVR